MTVNIITLGCSKNLVDSERLLYQFRAAGHRVLHDNYEEKADLVIINTCGFILDAKEESVDTVLSFLEEKRRGNLSRLFVMGCLSERYRDELQAELPGVDAFFGVWELGRILESAGSMLDEKLLSRRQTTTPSHYAYLKISEGCNRSCAFCAIPGIRGPQQSLRIEELEMEARHLASNGVKELILIAQDLSNYGTDIYQKRALPDLLRALVRIEEIQWIRLHYAYPTGFPEEVIDLMASEEKICNYLDIPIQHVNSEVLRAMGRGHDREKLEDLLGKFRERVPGVAIRTTVLTGFPGESQAAHEELMAYLSAFRFERLGVFPYSHEEDTPAYKLEDDVPARIKEQRAAEIMSLQQSISLELNEERVGETLKVIIDRLEGEYYLARTQYDSPEVDNEVLIAADAGKLNTGNFYMVEITGASEFDLNAEIVSGC